MHNNKSNFRRDVAINSCLVLGAFYYLAFNCSFSLLIHFDPVLAMKRVRIRISLTLVHVTLLLVSFTLAFVLNPYSREGALTEFDPGLTLSLLVWLIISSLSRKLEAGRSKTLRKLYLHIVLINLFIGVLAGLTLVVFKSPLYSVFIIFATVISATLLEVVVVSFLFSVKHAKTVKEAVPSSSNYSPLMEHFIQVEQILPGIRENKTAPPETRIDQALLEEAGTQVYQFIHSHIDLNDGKSIVFSTTTKFNVVRLPKGHYINLVNLKRINDIRHINKFFEAVNVKIPRHGVFIGCVETQEQRKQRIFIKFPPGINLAYYTLDFIVKRILPKFHLTKRLYFFLTRGKNRVISRAEVLGRLYCCGFEVVKEVFIEGYFYFVARKEKQPTYDFHPTYGPFIKLGRTGKGGRIIKVYKIRTMHPYSEYLQEYVYTHHYLRDGGKFNNDFRISTCGKFLRKFWIDETLMILNLLKGDIKLVGVRPLSIHYFNLYTEELKRKRIQFKPGLIPPFYADLPKTLEEIMASEMKYLEAYEKHPIQTDFKYFFLALCNILFKNSRSN